MKKELKNRQNQGMHLKLYLFYDRINGRDKLLFSVRKGQEFKYLKGKDLGKGLPHRKNGKYCAHFRAPDGSRTHILKTEKPLQIKEI